MRMHLCIFFMYVPGTCLAHPIMEMISLSYKLLRRVMARNSADSIEEDSPASGIAGSLPSKAISTLLSAHGTTVNLKCIHNSA